MSTREMWTDNAMELIEKLTVENERMRMALEQIAENELCHAGCPRDARHALAALAPSSTEKR